jgi:DNA primase
MSNITEWIKYELYPTLFNSIDLAFPELDFVRYSGGWRSKYKIDGSEPKNKRPDKTVITKMAPNYILEQGGENITLIDYVIRRNNIAFINAVKKLADVVNLELPKGDTNQENYQAHKEKLTLLEECNNYFIYSLNNVWGQEETDAHLLSLGYSQGTIDAYNKGYEVGFKKGDFDGFVSVYAIDNYLNNVRKYSKEDIKAMELGYIPSQDKLISHLLSKGYSQSLINDTLKLNKAIGSTHKLTIPYRSGGEIKGFKFRTTKDHKPKYINSTGLDKSTGFFNISEIKGDKDVVIVEGELDSLIASAKGIENVVATGGNSISPEMVKDALRRGAKKFSICFDREKGSFDKINKALEVILSEGVNNVYIVTLPEISGEYIEPNSSIHFTIDKTDPDSLIMLQGVEALQEAIDNAIPYYIFKLQETLTKYGEVENEKGQLTPKEIDSLLEEIIETASAITNPIHRDIYKKEFISLKAIKELGITEEAFAITVDNISSTRDKEKQSKDFKDLISKATDLHAKGDTAKALELLDKRVKDVKLQAKKTQFEDLLIPTTEEAVSKRQAQKPESLKTGYRIGGEDLIIPSGAITIIGAPTSHGKTAFLTNLALNVKFSDPTKQAYFFSYEEDSDSILINAFNIFSNNTYSKDNSKSIKSYYATGSDEYILKDMQNLFYKEKDRFFKEIIGSQKLNIKYIDYNSETLTEAIRHLHKNANVGAIFIDYIQLLNLPEGKYKTYSRQEEVKNICQALKDVAVETGLPIILGAQFNRQVKNPIQVTLNNLGEAGDIERIANLIIGLWNGNFPTTGTDGEINDTAKLGASQKGKIYATILKQREGKVGDYELFDFNGNTRKISNEDQKQASGLSFE